MEKLNVSQASLAGGGGYYISDNESDRLDEGMSVCLNMNFSEYIEILRKFGAYKDLSNGECYFKSKVDALKCVDHLNNNQVYKEHYKSEESEPQPPLGVMPEAIFERQRVQELSRALFEYIDAGNKDYDMLVKWSEEIQDRLQNLKIIEEKGEDI